MGAESPNSMSLASDIVVPCQRFSESGPIGSSFTPMIDEAEYVHVERADNAAKFWLDPIRLERHGNFDIRELRSIQRIIEEHQAELVEAWHEYFSG